MATDATGTPTSLGIPKFNTAVDSPSGLGSNAQMDAIDALLVARKPTPTSSGVKVWNNGTGAWDAVTGTPDGTKFLRDDGSWQSVAVATPEQAYNEITSNASITATTEATANTIVTASAFTADGSSRYEIEFQCALARSANSTSMQYFLYDGSSSIGIIGQTDTDASGNGHPVRISRCLIPSAASKTYSIRAKVTSGTGTVYAGAGGSGNLMPAYIRIRRMA